MSARQTEALARASRVSSQVGLATRDIEGDMASLAVRITQQSQNLRSIENQADTMVNHISQSIDQAERAHSGAQSLSSEVAKVDRLVLGMSGNSEQVASRVALIAQSISEMRTGLNELTNTFADNAADVTRASKRISNVTKITDELLQTIAISGAETADTPYINFALNSARQIMESMANLIADRKISRTELFSNSYIPITGTNPEQFKHPALIHLEPVMRPLQQELATLDGAFSMALSDRNRYIAVHMPNMSESQSSDPEWNNQHCRNMRIFDDVTDFAAANNREPFILQTFRRSLGEGKTLLVKEIVVSLWVGESFWGSLLLAYNDPA